MRSRDRRALKSGSDRPAIARAIDKSALFIPTFNYRVVKRLDPRARSLPRDDFLRREFAAEGSRNDVVHPTDINHTRRFSCPTSDASPPGVIFVGGCYSAGEEREERKKGSMIRTVTSVASSLVSRRTVASPRRDNHRYFLFRIPISRLNVTRWAEIAACGRYSIR